jgi:hypothetical protein
MCAVQDKDSGRYFTRACRDVYNVTETTYSSEDLIGEYEEICPYFNQCGLAGRGGCASDGAGSQDLNFTFVGRVGRVTAYDSTPITPVVSVTFNNGRSSYVFQEDTLKLEYDKSGYEIWWVQRTRSNFIVQKRKGFNVTSPKCTFDHVNDRYFPWAEIDKDGNRLELT